VTLPFFMVSGHFHNPVRNQHKAIASSTNTKDHPRSLLNRLMRPVILENRLCYFLAIDHESKPGRSLGGQSERIFR
jgi:hypothetical protein